MHADMMDYCGFEAEVVHISGDYTADDATVSSAYEESDAEVVADTEVADYISHEETVSTYDASDAEVADYENVEDAADGLFFMRMADTNSGHECHESDVGRMDDLGDMIPIILDDDDCDDSNVQPTGPYNDKRVGLVVIESAVGEKEGENAFECIIYLLLTRLL